jgi:hypothetical protein
MTDRDVLETAYHKQVETAYAAFVQSFILAKGDATAIDAASVKFTQAVRTSRDILAHAIKALP